MQLIKNIVRTKKTETVLKKQNKYVLQVDPRLTKPQIKKLCERYFGVAIKSVNTHILPAKKKRMGLQQGYKTRYKRAIITLTQEAADALNAAAGMDQENSMEESTETAPEIKSQTEQPVAANAAVD